MDTDSLMDVDAVAQKIQVKPSTIRSYHKRGQMPKADKYFGRTPVWTTDTIATWMGNRKKDQP